MSMFKELYELARGATLTLTISAEEKQGKLTINVIPKPKNDAGETALSTPLTLTATPEEFDADFIGALGGYRAAHRSLAEQALVTRELLDAAKEASAKKGTGAVAKANAKAAPAATRASTPADDDVEPDDEGGSLNRETPAPAPTPATPPSAEPQLFG